MSDEFTDLTNAIAQMACPSADETKHLHRCMLVLRRWIEAEIDRWIAEHAAQTATHTHVLNHDEPRIYPPPYMRALTEVERRRLREGKWEESAVSDPFASLSPAEREQAFEDTVRARQAEFEAGIQSGLSKTAAAKKRKGRLAPYGGEGTA